MRRPGTLLLAGALAAVAGCGGGSGGSGGGAPTAPTNTTGNSGGTGGAGTAGSGTASTTNAIVVRDNSFDPNATTVAVGTTVTWTWNGIAQHNVTFDDKTASSTQTSGTFTRTFAAAGTFPYHCTIHGAGMAGTITVK